MRLLNTKSYEFKEFFDSERPPYGILSHTWGANECDIATFRAARSYERKKPSDRRRDRPAGPAGYTKIVEFCNLARKESLTWVWVDTCCIDKTSSSELGEAINSMYSWYKEAKQCFVYMDDVDVGLALQDQTGRVQLGRPHLASEDELRAFQKSRWFTRGWTLQELLAPQLVTFFARGWQELGHRDDVASGFSALISRATRIRVEHLLDHSSCGSVAEIMSWAAGRKTSRIEDRAYSLFGLFDVNMPLIYGEGSKAFQRLQKEIIGQIDDESIFAWWSQTVNGHRPRVWHGLLAESPDDFALSAGIYPVATVIRGPGTITSRGLRLEVPNFTGSPFALRLNCRYSCDHPVHIVIECPEDQLIVPDHKVAALHRAHMGVFVRTSTYTPQEAVSASRVKSDPVAATAEYAYIYLALDQRVASRRIAIWEATQERPSEVGVLTTRR